MAPATAVNVAADAPAGTVTEAGTGSSGLLEAIAATVAAGAALFSATVQTVLAPAAKLLGAHAKELSVGEAIRLKVALCATPFHTAVTAAF